MRTAKRRKSDLPFGSQFSPSQIDLSRVLDIVQESGGTTGEFTEKIRAEFFPRHASGDVHQQREIAKNIRLSLREYHVVGEDERFTEFGLRLHSLKHDEAKLFEELARHILLNLHGIDLLRAIASLKALREEPTLIAIAKELERAGIHVPPSGTHVSSMKQWLQESRVLDDGLNIDEARLRSLIGYGLEDVDLLATFGAEQRAFIRAMAALAPADWTSSAEIARHAEAMSHVEYNPKDLRHQVIFPLGEGGYLEYRKSTTGRGAKPYEVRPTEKFQAEFLLPLLDALTTAAGASREVLQAPLEKVIADLQSEKKDVKGKALELLAMHLCRLLGLALVAWRHRWKETGGAEVDVLAEGTNYVFTRWEIQCKNTAHVGLDDIAREVGIADFYHANVVMIVTTGRYAKPARDFAERKMEKSAMNLVLIDGKDLEDIVKAPSSIGTVLRRYAHRVMRLKRLEEVAGAEDHG